MPRRFTSPRNGWIADFNDATSFLGLQKSSTGEQNYGDYKNPRFDALLDAADNEPDVARRAEDLRQAEAVMLDDAAVVPITFAINKNLVNPKITGWVENIVDHHRARWLCEKNAASRAKGE